MLRSAKARVSGIVRGAVAGYPAAALAFAALAAAVRLTCRDRWPGVSTLFYATPPIVTAFLVAAGSAMWYLRGRRRAAIRALAVVAALAAWFAAAGMRPAGRSDRDPDPSAVRVLFWNVGWGQMLWDRLAADVGRYSADVLVLVETGKPKVEESGDPPAGYEVVAPGNGIRVLVRGRVESSELRRLGDSGRLGRFGIAVGDRRFEVLLCDLPSNPLRSRGPWFDEIHPWLGEGTERPRVLVGDFNTPPESVHFDPIRRSWRRAFEVAGEGFDATWPVPAPVLALDHAWVGPGVGVRACRYGWSWRSDHRPVVVDLEIPAE